MSNLKTEVKFITPHEATEILKRNDSNRHIVESFVNALAADMKEGKFVNNGETIKISKDGNLIDGQHRLNACIRSGVTIETIIVSGIDKKHFHTIDCGRKRTASDVLKALGYEKSGPLSSIIKAYYMYMSDKKGWSGGANSPSYQKLTELAAKDIDVNNFACNLITKSLRRGDIKISVSVLGILVRVSLNAGVSKNIMVDFVEKITAGYGLEKNDAALYFRTSLRRRCEIARVPNTTVIELLARTFVKHLRGKKVFTMAIKNNYTYRRCFKEIYEAMRVYKFNNLNTGETNETAK